MWLQATPCINHAPFKLLIFPAIRIVGYAYSLDGWRMGFAAAVGTLGIYFDGREREREREREKERERESSACMMYA
jgi:hypothetical protein